jgi:tetratricopeptide (TPR) repeat protein
LRETPRRPRGGTCVAVLWLLVAPFCAVTHAQQSEADIFVAEAILAVAERRWEQALTLLREALTLDPTNADAHYYVGAVEIARGRLDAAIAALERARALAPGELAVALQLGLAYVAQQRWELAEPLLAEVFRARPQEDGVGYYVGFMRYRRRDYRGALDAFRAGATTDANLQQLTRFYSGLALIALDCPSARRQRSTRRSARGRRRRSPGPPSACDRASRLPPGATVGCPARSAWGCSTTATWW